MRAPGVCVEHITEFNLCVLQCHLTVAAVRPYCTAYELVLYLCTNGSGCRLVQTQVFLRRARSTSPVSLAVTPLVAAPRHQ